MGGLLEGECYIIGDDPHTYATGEAALEARDTYREDHDNDSIDIYTVTGIDGDGDPEKEREILAYLDNGWTTCPACQSCDIEAIKWDPLLYGAECLVWCRRCKAEWRARYALAGFTMGR